MKILFFTILVIFSFKVSANNTELKCTCSEYVTFNAEIDQWVRNYECQDTVTILKINTDDKTVYMDKKLWSYKDFQQTKILWGEVLKEGSHLTTLDRYNGTLEEDRLFTEEKNWIFAYRIKSKCEKNEKLF